MPSHRADADSGIGEEEDGRADKLFQRKPNTAEKISGAGESKVKVFITN